MSKYLYLLVLMTVVGCAAKVAVPEIKNSTQMTTKKTIKFSDKNRPVFFYGDNIGGHTSGRVDLANPWPFILWMQTQTGTEKTCNTPMFKTAYPGGATYFDQRVYDSVEIGSCPNLPGRCFLISDKWYRGTVQERLDEAEACDPALNDSKSP